MTLLSVSLCRGSDFDPPQFASMRHAQWPRLPVLEKGEHIANSGGARAPLFRSIASSWARSVIDWWFRSWRSDLNPQHIAGHGPNSTGVELRIQQNAPALIVRMHHMHRAIIRY
jgi:hypothetical protein